ncbi:TauD/TfdA family dioxygenase [Acidithiobacillus sp. M4-SHS-6]|uniref:TauD/TfdA family dioxygenase n=1 Tax=Acidithiobacillus sp. M4-SHS-6 TaxID=3383024 RepID=UPI0039BE5886
MSKIQIQQIALDNTETADLNGLVIQIRSECPGQIQSRYISRILAHSDRLPRRLRDYFWSECTPLVVTNLPMYDDIENSKILLLVLGETIGKCVGYSEYNQSFITDIRPTIYSNEASSRRDLLCMHSDLAFATDNCRPVVLVLMPHIANDDAPKTLIATAEEIVAQLPTDKFDLLKERIFEIRSGEKLRWPCEQVRRISVIDYDKNSRLRIRLNFGSINLIAGLNNDIAAKARDALETVTQEALYIGRRMGHRLQKGQALLIPNDYCLHGRDVFEKEKTDRLLLRSYVVTEETVDLQHGNTMISLRS